MGIYINGINYTNLVTGPGLSLSASPDQYGNITLSTISGANEASTANPLSQFAATTSAQLLATITNPTGTGALVFGTNATLITPVVTLPSTLSNHFYTNSSTPAQAPSATVRTYITGSAIGPFAAGAPAAGTVLRWRFDLTKTGAGSATSTFDIAFGTTGTVIRSRKFPDPSPAQAVRRVTRRISQYMNSGTNVASAASAGRRNSTVGSSGIPPST